MSIVLSSNTSDFKYNFYPSIKLDNYKTHEIALLNIDMYHSVPNIDESNNKFVYENDGKIFEINFQQVLMRFKRLMITFKNNLIKISIQKHLTLKQIISL